MNIQPDFPVIDSVARTSFDKSDSLGAQRLYVHHPPTRTHIDIAILSGEWKVEEPVPDTQAPNPDKEHVRRSVDRTAAEWRWTKPGLDHTLRPGRFLPVD